ncbi:hypothetical protein GUITHDRAFT_108205 [Guillardia theta CCMP2712]|uniref:Protein kinase domain-containing protein n=1 Tax=Guillardia theta (strain CCMP2712) TaxID=905079 RepID=L1JBR9_GUITC|nr:hypothetical protein GUITHDRAFT_108205 [Guillardia theta CCMP2712]EKX45747.1 hypothetical protein GUITHDRAFT_108205 [Guillardia theta CCMP2712]|eukprot:XP_005832727.1 hypothetical protein GUITHDRAFT_108205 [Guillardia theta CCMP2712]
MAEEEQQRCLREERQARERQTREMMERERAQAQEERRMKEEAERRRAQQAAQKAREEAERQRARQEQQILLQAREEEMRRARDEAKKEQEWERRAREVRERQAREEAERKAREEAERKAREEAASARPGRRPSARPGGAERKAREEAERKAREEAERKAREEAEREAREEAERKAREEAERKAREEAEREAREEAERKAREEAERKAREEAGGRQWNETLVVDDANDFSSSLRFSVFKCIITIGQQSRKGVIKVAKEKEADDLLRHDWDVYKKLVNRSSSAHDYIVECLHAEGSCAGFFALVTERAKRSLAGWMSEASLNAHKAHRQGIIRQLGWIVGFMHECGLVWMGISADNFLVFSDLRIKATNFTYAGEVGSLANHADDAACCFVAPELLKDATCRQRLTFEMDAWSFGVTAFQVFTRRDLYSCLGLSDPVEISQFWEGGNERILQERVAHEFTGLQTDQQVLRFLLGRDGVGGVLREDPSRRRTVLQSLKECSLFTEQETVMGLHVKIDRMAENMRQLKKEISEMKPFINDGMQVLIYQAATNERINKELCKLRSSLSSISKRDGDLINQSQQLCSKVAGLCNVMHDMSRQVQGHCSQHMQEISQRFDLLIQQCQRGSDDEKKEILERLLEQVGVMQQQLGNVEDQVNDIKKRMEEAINASRSAVWLLNQACLSEARGKMAPYLVWIYPQEEVESWNPTDWITNKLCIKFICPVSLKLADKTFETFTVKESVQLFAEMIPPTLNALKPALEKVRWLNLPLAGLSSLESELKKQRAFSQKLTELEAVDMMSSWAQKHFQGVSSDAQEPDLNCNRKGIKALVQFMESVDRNWTAKTGLQLVSAQDGTVEWVHPEVAKDFKEKGREMLRGRRDHLTL